jgi:hypothetical protein
MRKLFAVIAIFALVGVAFAGQVTVGVWLNNGAIVTTDYIK